MSQPAERHLESCALERADGTCNRCAADYLMTERKCDLIKTLVREYCASVRPDCPPDMNRYGPLLKHLLECESCRASCGKICWLAMWDTHVLNPYDAFGDIAAETEVLLLSRKYTWIPKETYPSRWIYVNAKYACGSYVNQQRKHESKRVRLDKNGQNPLENRKANPEDYDPVLVAIRRARDLEKEVGDEIRKLPERERAVIYCCFFLKPEIMKPLPLKEIRDCLHISMSTASRTLRKAYDKLRLVLRPKLYK